MSSIEKPLEDNILPEYNPNEAKTEKTVLYLAYGSNLCAETFRGRRKIKPLSATNVVVPALEVVFDLPGLPYVEPRFANTRFRPGYDPPKQVDHKTFEVAKQLKDANNHLPTATALGWKKGLVGVVYEVTETDYARIIATEGAGSSYADIEIECFKLDRGADTVPEFPSAEAFKAHTLFASGSNRDLGDRRGWAEPSPRYKKLLMDGALEHGLPNDYQDWMQRLQPYQPSTLWQKFGRGTMLTTWWPLVMVVFRMQPFFVNDKGQAPTWLKILTGRLFSSMWWTYDHVYKPVFGDGERT